MILVPIRFDVVPSIFCAASEAESNTDGHGKRTCTLTFPLVDYHDADLRLRTTDATKPVRRFEVNQSIHDEPLHADPEIRRSSTAVISVLWVVNAADRMVPRSVVRLTFRLRLIIAARLTHHCGPEV